LVFVSFGEVLNFIYDPNPTNNQEESVSEKCLEGPVLKFMAEVHGGCVLGKINGLIVTPFRVDVDAELAARIVACVNFCAGLSNEEIIELESVKAELFHNAESIRQLRAELEAAKAKATWVDKYLSDRTDHWVFEKFGLDASKELRTLIEKGK
jgi:hypothetical protein